MASRKWEKIRSSPLGRCPKCGGKITDINSHNLQAGKKTTYIMKEALIAIYRCHNCGYFISSILTNQSLLIKDKPNNEMVKEATQELTPSHILERLNCS